MESELSNLALIIDAMHGVSMVTRAEVAAAALFVWDYFITIGMEVDLVWTSRWNSIKVLFLIQRYLPFIDTCILTLYRDLVPRGHDECTSFQKATGFLYITGFAVSELLLTMRVWAVWNRSKALGYLLPMAFIAVWVPAYVFMFFFANSLQFSKEPPLPGITGCFVIHASNLVIWCWTSLIIWNTITLILMLIPGWRAYKIGVNSTLSTIVYRDGTFYYIYLFILSVLNIVLAIAAAPTRRFVLTSMERCLHSMLATRVILHMRDHARRPQLEWVGGEFSTGAVEFATGGHISAVPQNIEADPMAFKMKPIH
ncbi:hypothetical protein JR316_0002420 [Psilocybe cubensis]|uniref:Uncharacterized protein n=2 Tax=Psilocybe cubensis TaxID=181762 RepID=A0ACB8HCY9_PSICU|nr:hypothetical protein JR316_0002420 [Psilocybe cubensis]KAH9485512.1 hypothetical protein JR316_0002420 [Psilocybe cubensis]